MRLIEKIDESAPSAGEISLFYLGQAGFCIRTSRKKTIVVDPYLSDACERLFGFKRMIPSVIDPKEFNPDLYLSTHHHADHLDPDALPVIAKNKKTIFLGAIDCESLYTEIKISKDRYTLLKEGDQWRDEEILVRAVYADHGDLAPDAIGLLIDINGLKIYHAGDTAYRPDEIISSLGTDIDIMIVPINGQYGNMIAKEACKLAAEVKPKVVIGCHFWMFLEHVAEEGKGDPATFLKESSILSQGVTAIIMAPGELIKYSKQGN